MSNRLMVLDDDPHFAALAAAVAKSAGYDVLAITDSTLFEASLRSWRPTHVVIDLNMPTVDGLEALQLLARARSKAKVFICSAAGANFVEAVNRLGGRLGLMMSGVTHKPVRPQDLKNLLLSVRETSGPATSVPTFDIDFFDEVRSTMGDDWVVEGLKNLAVSIEATFKDQSVPTDRLDRSAHALASYAGMLGFSEFSLICCELEETCRNDADASSPLLQRAQAAAGVVCVKAREMITHLGACPSKCLDEAARG